MKRKFTLPGEAGYENLTLELAKRWGADVIRDSDGTKLSDEIFSAGYKIYSTICPIREHNPWIRENMHARQQTFLSTPAATATDTKLTVPLMCSFFDSQLSINDSSNAMPYWQVYDRTSDTLVPGDMWQYENGAVTISGTIPYRQYTVSFLAWRNWEEISMYNHTTNNWDKEKLMQLNPYAEGCLEYLKDWFVEWCKAHPHADVVRFTSLFYNFAWIWGSDPRNRHLFTDWASYDFTVCPEALDDFHKEYGYRLTAEDFVRQGKYNATHRVPTQSKRDWMDFISAYVRRATRELVDIIHAAGKKAYVFYDDSWVGMEPYNGHFGEMNFDGLIKCVFSGYEARLCSGVDVPIHEIRFHPYLFPVGLGGAPTFSPGGEPGKDALGYWMNVRRALLREKIERSGLGGYLHLVQDYPCFVEAMDTILTEFETISALHDCGSPMVLKPRVAVLHAWGALRTWTLSGHFHETDKHILIHVLEALSGLPFDVKFLSFDDVKNGVPEDIDVIINAGEAGSAWSGGEYWRSPGLVESITQWVYNGGVFMGIGEPSAVPGYSTYLRMAHVLGVDIDNGEKACHGRWQYNVQPEPGITATYNNLDMRKNSALLTDGKVRVLAASDMPDVVINNFGKGKGVYLSGFEYCHTFARTLQNLITLAACGMAYADGTPDNPNVECAVFPGKIVFINNSEVVQKANCCLQGRQFDVELCPYEMKEVAI
ncbi:MAG: 1,3-beta-galactosyl-N-acetylhexosamine phosphorylase [Firmicutes bacterium]|nr:1,3-beta-galactosyl-N-acetylhexosamine phosphorylase [Bacillota bacterium]